MSGKHEAERLRNLLGKLSEEEKGLRDSIEKRIKALEEQQTVYKDGKN